MSNLPPPMVPAEVDLRDFQFMPLDVVRLRDSDLAAVEDGEVFRAAVLSWCVSWHQVPAASLPNDDAVLCRLLGYGRDVKLWQKLRANGALRGWELCSDNRLYHRVVAEKAKEAWLGKLKQRWQQECSRIKKHNQRHGTTVETPDFSEWASLGCPQGQPLPVPRTQPDCPQGQPPPVLGTQPGTEDETEAGTDTHCPDAVPQIRSSKGQGEGQGEGQLLERQPPLSKPPAAPPVLDCPQRDLLALYAKHLPMLRQPRVWDGQRAELLRTRWRYCSKPNGIGSGYETVEKGLNFWEEFFAFVARSKKLTEGIPYEDGTLWKPDLPWLLEAKNFAKVVEGKFH